MDTGSALNSSHVESSRPKSALISVRECASHERFPERKPFCALNLKDPVCALECVPCVRGAQNRFGPEVVARKSGAPAATTPDLVCGSPHLIP